MTNGKKTLGILGGMGPLASAHFLRLVLSHTIAENDGDHLDIVMTSRASTPDRTAHLLGRISKNPLDTLKIDIDTLILGGADVIAVPCNTVMAYYDELSLYSPVPILNIVKLTAERAALCGAKTVAVLATEGTVMTNIYQKELDRLGVKCALPDKRVQNMINKIIYRKIKAGVCEVNEIYPLFDTFLHASDAIVLGCTELSMICLDGYENKKYIIDSSCVLAEKAIVLCGGKLKDL